MEDTSFDVSKASSSQDPLHYTGQVLRLIGIKKHHVNLQVIFLCVLNCLINFDHGAIPAALKKISVDLNIGEGKLGGLGSLIFVGLVLGSFTASKLFYLLEYKTIICCSLALNSISLWMLTQFCDVYMIMGFSRLVAGFAQIFITLYLPLYIDTFIEENKKANYMPLASLSALVGTIIGYALTSVIINQDKSEIGANNEETPFYRGTWQQSINL